MSNVEVYVVVEGHTEQTFIREVLAPHLAVRKVFLRAPLIGQSGHKGGNIRFDRAVRDIRNFLKCSKTRCVYVSTMFDYFRIEPDWPGRADVSRRLAGGSKLSAVEKAAVMESATLARMTELVSHPQVDKRFIPYFSMHEFEALLFSDADTLARSIRVGVTRIQDVLAGHASPEDINDDPDGAPSKRLLALNPAYRKVAMGKTIAEAVGIDQMRERCPHFDAWVGKLESLR